MNTTDARNKLNVLFLAQLPPPIHGVTTISEKVYRLLAARGDVRVEHLWLGSARDLRDIGRRSLAKATALLALFSRLIGMCLRGRRYNVAYLTLAPWTHAAVRDAAVASIAKHLADRVVVHLHGEGLDRVVFAATLRDRVIRRLLTGTELIAITQQAFDLGRASQLFAAVHRLPNSAPDPGPLRICKKTVLTCGFLGNLDPRKGALAVLDAVRIARSCGLLVEGRIAGAATPLLNEDYLRAAAARIGVADAIDVTGPVYNEAKQQFLAGLDIFIYLSRHDHAPLVLIEALSHGLVPIVLDTGGLREIVGPDFSDHVLATNSTAAEQSKAVVRIVRSYCEDPLHLSTNRVAARERYLAAYTPHAFDERICAILGISGPTQVALESSSRTAALIKEVEW